MSNKIKNLFHTILLAAGVCVFLNLVFTLLEYVLIRVHPPAEMTFWIKYPFLLGMIMGITASIAGIIAGKVMKMNSVNMVFVFAVLVPVMSYANYGLTGENDFRSSLSFQYGVSVTSIMFNFIVAAGLVLVAGFLYRVIHAHETVFCSVCIIGFLGTAILAWWPVNNPDDTHESPLSDSVRSTQYPNIFVLSIDTLRADYLGCFGNPEVSTPAIDRLAHDSLMYTNCFATSPWTRASFASIFSGTYPHQTGAIQKNLFVQRDQQKDLLAFDFALDADVPWLPEILKNLGYETAGFQSNLFVSPYYGFNRGFDTYVMASSLRPHMPVVARLARSLEISTDEFGIHHIIGLDSIHLTDSFIQWISKRSGSGNPLFAWLNLMEVHEPHVDPRIPRNKVASAMQYFEQIKNNPNMKNYMKSAYKAEVEFVDELVAKIIDHLRILQLDKNSIVVFLSDHGQELFDYTNQRTDPLYLKPRILGHGYSMSDELVHVPLTISYPGCTPRKIDSLCSLIDLMPTILALIPCNTEYLDRMDGEILPNVNNSPSNPERTVFCESTNLGSERKCVITEYAKLEWFGPPVGVEYTVPSGFFQWKNEKNNIQEMQKLLAEFVNKANQQEALIMNRAETVPLNPSVIDALKALGYMQ